MTDDTKRCDRAAEQGFAECGDDLCPDCYTKQGECWYPDQPCGASGPASDPCPGCDTKRGETVCAHMRNPMTCRDCDTKHGTRAWTPGPWLYRPKSGSWHVASDTHPYGLPFITTPDSCDMEFANDADAELIVLAAEMAEAILWGACDAFNGNTGQQECGCPLCVAAYKLRRIGVSS